MGKIFYQEVAKCSEDGKLRINDIETLENYTRDLIGSPQTISKMEELLRFGTACIKEGHETHALSIFQAAYHLLSPLVCDNCKKLEYAHAIYNAFCTLNSSNNEYVWECTGEFIVACREFINKISPEPL